MVGAGRLRLNCQTTSRLSKHLYRLLFLVIAILFTGEAAKSEVQEAGDGETRYVIEWADNPPILVSRYWQNREAGSFFEKEIREIISIDSSLVVRSDQKTTIYSFDCLKSLMVGKRGCLVVEIGLPNAELFFYDESYYYFSADEINYLRVSRHENELGFHAEMIPMGINFGHQGFISERDQQLFKRKLTQYKIKALAYFFINMWWLAFDLHAIYFDNKNSSVSGLTMISRKSGDIIFLQNNQRPVFLGKWGPMQLAIRFYSLNMQPVFSDGNHIYYLNGELVAKGKQSYGDYARPISSNNSAVLLGIHDEKSVLLLDNDLTAFNSNIRTVLNSYIGDHLIQGVTISTALSQLYVLLRKGDKQCLIAFNYRRQKDEIFWECDVKRKTKTKSKGLSSQPISIVGSNRNKGVGYRIELELVSNDQSTLPIRLYRISPKQNRGIVVYFHGGPGDHATYEAKIGDIMPYLRMGYDVAIPAYAGTTAPLKAKASELAGNGVSAMESDIELIYQWLRNTDYRRKIFVGASYGGAYFIVLNNREDSVFNKYILLAPLLKYRNREIWTPKVFGEKKIDNKLFIPRDKNLFGDQIIDQSSELRMFYNIETCNVKGSIHAIFGEFDDVSRAEDLEGCLDKTGVKILDKTIHSLVGLKSRAVVDSILQ